LFSCSEEYSANMFVCSSKTWKCAHLVSCERDLHVWVDQILALPGQCLLHTSHHTSVHLGQTLGLEDAHGEVGTLPVCWYAIRQQQVSGEKYHIEGLVKKHCIW